MRASQAVQLLLTADVIAVGKHRWDGEARGGRVAISPALMGLVRTGPTTVLQARLSATAWQVSLDPDDEVAAPLVMAALGVSWTSPGRDHGP